MRLIWKLLRKHISLFELSVFFIANLIGMVVILGGIQIYSDLKPLVAGENALVGNDYVVISKPVKRLNSKSVFSTEEIEELKAQDFVLRLGEFTPAQYQVFGGINIGGQGFSTYMFFEAIPDNFVDVKSKEWKFSKGKRKVPIIIPRNYLNLYNFGFSQTSAQLPQITESMMKDLELELTLSGGNHKDKLVGKVVGFTDRLNTILVPQKFIEWSNKRYAKGESIDEAAFAEGKKRFTDALDNDLNTSLAVTALYDVFKLNTNDATKLALIKDFERVLSLGLIEAREKALANKGADASADADIPAELLEYINTMIEARRQAKKEKNFAEADRIRGELLERGISILDTREGTKFTIEK